MNRILSGDFGDFVLPRVVMNKSQTFNFLMHIYLSIITLKTSVLRIASWNVRTMSPGLTDDLQKIDEARKTAIIASIVS